MRALLLVLVVLTTACHLDLDSKPECVTDDHCYGGHCVMQECIPDQPPVTVQDVFYVYADATTVTGNVTANDSDPEGDPVSLYNHYDYADRVTVLDTENVEVNLYGRGALFDYYVTDGIENTTGEIRVVYVPASSTIPITPNATANVTWALGNTYRPADLEIVSAPTHGTLADSIYTPDANFCGTDSVGYVLHGDNGDLPVVVTFDVNIALANDAITIPFGTSSVAHVLDNDGTGLELTSVSSTTATISDDKQTLVVTPPAGTAGSYLVEYHAENAFGCEASATLTVKTTFPTSVLVGAGLVGDSFDPTMSGDGRFVAFTSSDSTLVDGDTNGVTDVFVLDIETGGIERISVASDGTQGNGASNSPSMSLDGRYVAFSSTATNLAAADTTSVEDVYLHDRTTGATTLVSISLDSTGSNQPSVTPALSADGTHIAFTSSATRLIATDTNNVADVFVRDLTANTTKRVSTKVNGGQATFASLPRPRISGDGHYVVLSANGAFDAPATTNAGTFLVDTTALGVTRMSDTTGPFDVDNAVRYVLFGDPSSWSNILDRVVNTVTELGAASDGALAANGTCSAIAWQGRINARCGTTTASVIVGPDGAEVVADVLRRPALSADGRWIVFATNVWSGEEGHYVIVRVWNRAHTP